MSVPIRLGVSLVLLSAMGCRGETSASTPIVPLRNMYDQQRYDPQQQSEFFDDGRVMRMPVEHTVAREAIIDPAAGSGRDPNGNGYVLTIPDEVLEGLGGMEGALARGENRYGVYCTPCHDGTGAGAGLVVERGMQKPPSLHDPRIRSMPDGQLFATISNGVRTMPAYGAIVPTADRWAIVSYVRALQLAEPKAGE